MLAPRRWWWATLRCSLPTSITQRFVLCAVFARPFRPVLGPTHESPQARYREEAKLTQSTAQYLQLSDELQAATTSPNFYSPLGLSRIHHNSCCVRAVRCRSASKTTMSSCKKQVTQERRVWRSLPASRGSFTRISSCRSTDEHCARCLALMAKSWEFA